LPLCDCVVWGACGFPFSVFSIISNFELILKVLCFIAYFLIIEAFIMTFNGHIKAPRFLNFHSGAFPKIFQTFPPKNSLKMNIKNSQKKAK
jgi:hypothetical protein